MYGYGPGSGGPGGITGVSIPPNQSNNHNSQNANPMNNETTAAKKKPTNPIQFAQAAVADYINRLQHAHPPPAMQQR
jgi:hypothetical protein